ncbi:DUF899 family protein [bacterium]|nr:DUF899 family protein [bacterium]
MQSTISSPQIEEKEAQIQQLRSEINAMRQGLAAMPVQDYELTRPDGSACRLSDFVGVNDQLILIHNMGFACPYCTMWADGFNSLWRYLAKRSGFVLLSNDRPDQQLAGMQKRGWTFPMATARGTSLFADLGFQDAPGADGAPGGWWPGLSSIYRQDGQLMRHNAAIFGPGDDFCSIWHMFPLLQNNDESIEPTAGM